MTEGRFRPGAYAHSSDLRERPSVEEHGIGKRGTTMENIDLCGIAQLLRTLVILEKTTEQEARAILSRISAETGTSIIIYL